MTEKLAQPKRGEIWMANVARPNGEKSSAAYYDKHPYLIINNNKWSEGSLCFNVFPITSSRRNKRSPVHVRLPLGSVPGLTKDSTVLCENITTLDRSQLLYKMGELTMEQRKDVAVAQVIQTPDIALAFNSGVENTAIYKAVASY